MSIHDAVAKIVSKAPMVGTTLGWGMITAGTFAVQQWVIDDFSGARTQLARDGVELIQWSQVTGDSHDCCCFGVRRLKQHCLFPN